MSKPPAMNGRGRFSSLVEELVGAASSADRTEPHTKQAFDELLDDVWIAPTSEKANIVVLDKSTIASGSKRFMERVTEIRQMDTISLLKGELQRALAKVHECEAAFETTCGLPNDRRKRRAQEAVDEQLGQVEAARKRFRANATKVEENDSELEERQESQELGTITL
ncbi:hypothetical protein A1O7_05433 [Cladophialophora yegresii CBS 114405]|uniref:Uncharacterized protein n=1 Tax=Cladophialophora yegresii CBS 114405 TaxID=1182544 RepID=W9VZ75_9EURO|nr:uncharacterized protein A1O7_05433 [Cladophialophora yegresii CBS 114405]EXJ58010.1 hypothetical protein A1O7_05433 [Cladophialophora yegresii CBS 114405]